MRAAAHEYFKLMLPRWWCLSLGAAAGVVGLLADMEEITMPLPSWIWWERLALVALVALNFGRSPHSTKRSPRVVLGQGQICICTKYLTAYMKRLPLNHTQEDPIKNALNLIMERAATGEIKIFGTATDPSGGNGPAVPIDPVYWRKNSVTLYGNKTYFGLTDWQRERQMRTEGEAETYYALRADSSQVLLCWPQEKRLKFQLTLAGDGECRAVNICLKHSSGLP